MPSSIPLYQVSIPGQRWLSTYATTPDLPNFFDLGFKRLNEVFCNQNEIDNADQTLRNELARQLTWAPGGDPVPAGQVPGYFDMELSADPAGGFPDLDGAGGRTLGAATLTAVRLQIAAERALYPSAPETIYGQPSTSDGLASSLASANNQLTAAGITTQLGFVLTSLQQASHTLDFVSLSSWLAGIAPDDNIYADVWGTNAPWLWVVQYRYNDAPDLRMPRATWQGILAYVAQHAVPSRGDALAILDGYNRQWDAQADPPYYADIANAFTAGTPVLPPATPPTPGRDRYYFLKTAAGTYYPLRCA